MANGRRIYKCPICDTVVEVLDDCGLELVCCGPAMVAVHEQCIEQGSERHVPVIRRTPQGVLVKVGHVPHEMADDHYIEWIEVVAEGKVCRQFLKPGQEPQAQFQLAARSIIARAYCSQDGLWRSSPAVQKSIREMAQPEWAEPTMA